MKTFKRKFSGDGNILPKSYLNIKGYLRELPPPPLNPKTNEPINPSELEAIFPKGFIKNELSLDKEIEIPKPVYDIYQSYRPTPLYYAKKLKEHLNTPAHIFYKYEGVSPTGSHKPNTALAQAFCAKNEGFKNISTETGAGQWGSALAFAGSQFNINIEVYMVRVSYHQKPGRKVMIESLGSNIYPSPSNRTPFGMDILNKNPEHPGSLGIAISEAIFKAATNNDTVYSLGSVLDSVLLHQTIIGQESIKQIQMQDTYPDIVIGCAGGGSNFGGLCLPYVVDKLNGKKIRLVAVEPKAAPSLTEGEYRYDFGDSAGMTPLLKMHTLGHDFVPSPIHAGGLRYHGMSPMISFLKEKGLIEAVAYNQVDSLNAGLTFFRTEGILPAPEPTHAIKAVIDEAVKCKESGEEKVILFNLCGHGFFDYSAYGDLLAGKLN